MPRFYLNIRDGEDLIEDPEGSDLPDLAAARAEALSAARELLAERLKAGGVVNGQAMEIVDETGTVRAVIPFRDALQLD